MRKLLVVRPEPGASATVASARALGLDAVAMPLFEVRPLMWKAPDPDRFDGLLLTSANAVRHGGRKLEGLKALPVHAVGEATAAAARQAGFAVELTGSGSAEQLLAEVPQDMRLLHLCGADRTHFNARQPITAIAVYSSDAIEAPAGFAQVEGAVVALHSIRAARRFVEVCDAAVLDRATIAIAGLSGAVAAAAGEGWDAAAAAAEPTDDALLALAAKLCNKPAPE